MTPIFIISYNRYTALKALIDRLLQMGQTRLVVIDNTSTYEPLLQYYREVKGDGVRLVRGSRNFGHRVVRALYKDPEFRSAYQLDKEPYIYTDCDVVPDDDCPSDFVDVLRDILMGNPDVRKVGLGLHIDDLPDSFAAKGRVIKWESQYWRDGFVDLGGSIPLYHAPIDTTFALRRAGTAPGWTDQALRTGAPYMARHLSWYIDSEHLSEEDQYYLRSADRDITHFPARYLVGEGQWP